MVAFVDRAIQYKDAEKLQHKPGDITVPEWLNSQAEVYEPSVLEGPWTELSSDVLYFEVYNMAGQQWKAPDTFQKHHLLIWNYLPIRWNKTELQYCCYSKK